VTRSADRDPSVRAREIRAVSARQDAVSRTPRRSYAKIATTLTEAPERTSPIRLVVDTNVALKAYLEEDLADEAQRVLDAGRDGDAELLAPTLILLEFRHALTRRVRREDITASEVQEMWESFGDWPLDYFEIGPLVARAAEISGEAGCTIYDAIFVALAESAGLVVLTADGKLIKAIEGTDLASFLWSLDKVGELLEVH
jgi:predicted nucleic acid-binding protein